MYRSPPPANQNRAGYLNQPIRREPGPRDVLLARLCGLAKRTFLPRGDSVPRGGSLSGPHNFFFVSLVDLKSQTDSIAATVLL
jgi:hypothetical protein